MGQAMSTHDPGIATRGPTRGAQLPKAPEGLPARLASRRYVPPALSRHERITDILVYRVQTFDQSETLGTCIQRV